MKTAYRIMGCAWVAPLLLCHDVNVRAQTITASRGQSPSEITLNWTAQPGLSYSIQSADNALGPWTPSATLQADNQTLQWSSTIVTTERQRFFRITAQTPANETPALQASAQLPTTLGSTALDSASIGAQAAFLASILGAGGSQLLTTGTLQETSRYGLPVDLELATPKAPRTLFSTRSISKAFDWIASRSAPNTFTPT